MNSPAYITRVNEYTFNPMRFIQAHFMYTTFVGNGACVNYYNGSLGTFYCDQDYETEIFHEWGTGGPSMYIYDHFAARWVGTISILSDSSRSWRFFVTTDDGAKLYVDNDLIIDRWIDQGPTTYVGYKNLTPGTHNVILEYYENTGDATILFGWGEGFKISIPFITGSSSGLLQPQAYPAPSP